MLGNLSLPPASQSCSYPLAIKSGWILLEIVLVAGHRLLLVADAFIDPAEVQLSLSLVYRGTFTGQTLINLQGHLPRPLGLLGFSQALQDLAMKGMGKISTLEEIIVAGDSPVILCLLEINIPQVHQGIDTHFGGAVALFYFFHLGCRGCICKGANIAGGIGRIESDGLFVKASGLSFTAGPKHKKPTGGYEKESHYRGCSDNNLQIIPAPGYYFATECYEFIGLL